jgi:alcohol dehydrogenase class IV
VLGFADTSIREIYNAPQVVTGDNAITQVGEYMHVLQPQRERVLIVVDHALCSLGIADRISEALSIVGFSSDVFSDINTEPGLEIVNLLCQVARAKPYCGTIGVGGGSAMDLAKFAALLATNLDDPAIYVGGGAFKNKRLPLILIPTTAGTGAEVSKNSILSQGDRKIVVSNPGMVPDIAILDPMLTISAPPTITAASGLDALCHAVETYLSSWATTLTSVNSLAAAAKVAEWLPIAFSDGSNIEARRAMLYASHLAGIAINAGTILGHTMAYTIATRAHLPHGISTGMCLPYCLAYNASGAAKRIRELENTLQVDDLSSWVRQLCDVMDVPVNLTQIGLSRKDIPNMVRECLDVYPRPNNPVPFGQKQLTLLYEGFLIGDFNIMKRITRSTNG